MLSNKVVVTKIESDQRSSIFRAVESAIESLEGIDVSQGDKVIIKPDLGTCRPPNSGTTTDCRVVEAIINQIYRIGHNFKIYIVESDNDIRYANEAFERWVKLEKKYGVKLINLSSEEKIIVDLPNGRMFKELMVPKTLHQYDYFISVANLKIHAMEGISCVMKNQFGCIPEINKSMFHPYMSEVLYDLNEFYNPNLCIAGGLFGKEFNRELYLKTGYITGRPKRINMLVCGKDALATDIACAKLMGFDPVRIPYLKYAMKKRIGMRDPVLQTMGNVKVRNLNFQFVPINKYLRMRVLYKLLRFYNAVFNKKVSY